MTDPVLSQLVSVESDLAEQVELLEHQLTQLQAQRQGLHTVINMFEGADTAAPNLASPAEATEQVAEKPAATSPAKTTKSTTQSTAKTKTKAKPGPKAQKKTGGRKKKDGRAANWQKHVQSQYRDSALPEAVSSVLRSQPSEVFKIADVMSSIFKEDMPRTSYLKARNRISNILSAGARDGTWYRGRNGRYSQSESVTKIK
ncbi:MAG: hypothetical protein AAFP07_00605 [Cyanobacteria bacterium J06606_4]